MPEVISGSEREALRVELAERFSRNELAVLVFDLTGSTESVNGDSPAEFAAELIAYFERRGELASLIAKARRERPTSEVFAGMSEKLDGSPGASSIMVKINLPPGMDTAKVLALVESVLGRGAIEGTIPPASKDE